MTARARRHHRRQGRLRLRGEPEPGSGLLNVGSGRIREKKSLETLARNGFFSVEQGQGEMRITLGEKGRELLREVDEKAKATTAS